MISSFLGAWRLFSIVHEWTDAAQLHEKNMRTPKKELFNPSEVSDFRFTTVFPYHQRVFYCRDVHLYKPNYVPEDFNVYVSYPLLYSLGFTLPPLVVSLIYFEFKEWHLYVPEDLVLPYSYL